MMKPILSGAGKRYFVFGNGVESSVTNTFESERGVRDAGEQKSGGLNQV